MLLRTMAPAPSAVSTLRMGALASLREVPEEFIAASAVDIIEALLPQVFRPS